MSSDHSFIEIEDSSGRTRPKRRKRTLSTPATTVWPEKDPSKDNLPLDGLLAGLDDLGWAALAHVNPDEFRTKPCQVVMRQALTLIGMGWVATNTYKYRKAFGKGNKYDCAKKIHEARHWQQPAWPLPELTQVHVVDQPLTRRIACHVMEENDAEDDNNNDDSNTSVATFSILEQVKKQLAKNGVAMISHACSRIPPNATNTIAKRIKIQQSTGNGMAGTESFYADATSNYWNRVQVKILQSVLNEGGDDDFNQVAKTKKAIVLKYGSGAENWAHRDGNSCPIFPFQATVMVSNPQTDFEGGEFYVAKRERNQEGEYTGRIQRTIVEFQNPGDMVLFSAGGEYDHGMIKVTRGERVAVGLLQPK